MTSPQKVILSVFAGIGTVAGSFIGCFVLLDRNEARIEKRAKSEEVTNNRIQRVEDALKELKSDFFLDKAKSESAISTLQADSAAFRERMLRIELTK